MDGAEEAEGEGGVLGVLFAEMEGDFGSGEFVAKIKRMAGVDRFSGGFVSFHGLGDNLKRLGAVPVTVAIHQVQFTLLSKDSNV